MSQDERNRRPTSIVGIDLGTTQSVIAHLDAKGHVSTLPNRDGDMLTASAVYLQGDHALVGKAARRAAAHTPDNVATFIKRDIGRAWYSRLIDGRRFRPETLSAIILRKLKQDAQRRVAPIGRAVITVPAFFDDARRKAVQDAGRIAGFETVDIINEPTAAALAYCLEGQLAQNHVKPDFPQGKLTALVYDLGGGTFDVTAIHMDADRIDTLATDGAVKLGGKDWDDKIVSHVAALFEQRFGVRPDVTEAMIQHAESTKQLLSDLPSAPLECSFGGNQLSETLSRQAFEELTADLLDETEVVTKLVVKQAQYHGRQLGWDDFDRVLLVGGSTRMPMVREMLRRVAGRDADDSPDPDQVVARGAAVYAVILATQGKDGGLVIDADVHEKLEQIDVIDVNAHPLGIEAWKTKNKREKITAVLIPKNRQLPFAASQVFRTVEAGASKIRVRVLEGDAPDPSGNMLLGECVITELPPQLPRNSPVQVRLSYEANGRVRVMALDMTGGRFVHAEIERNSGLTEEDIVRETEFVNGLNIQ